jgi:hypothetical protein
MPYQLNGQLVTRKSKRLLHATGALTAAGGGAFVTMSADIAALGGAAMSNAETPPMQSVVRLMVIVIWRQLTLVRAFSQRFAVARRFEGDFCIAFQRIVATESQ